jgi:NAD(P)H-dependent FMN reductase
MIENPVIFISSPEYNHSLSGVLKNALDWASRSEAGGGSREAFEGKKFVLFSASPGKKGGAKSLVHLRDILEDMRANTFLQEFSLSDGNNAFNQNNKLKKLEIELALKQFVQKALE